VLGTKEYKTFRFLKKQFRGAWLVKLNLRSDDISR
jgi:hypothetical protein